MRVIGDIVRTNSIITPIGIIIDEVSSKKLKYLCFRTDKKYFPKSLEKIFKRYVGKKIKIEIEVLEIINDKKDFEKWNKKYRKSEERRKKK